MTVELVYKDGSTEIVERCFIVHDEKRDKKTGRMRPRERFVAQTQAGGKPKWIKPSELEKVNVELAEDQPLPPPWPSRHA